MSQEFAELIHKKYLEIDSENCPDCEDYREPVYRYCEVLCSQLNLLEAILRDLGYATNNKNELIKRS